MEHPPSIVCRPNILHRCPHSPQKGCKMRPPPHPPALTGCGHTQTSQSWDVTTQRRAWACLHTLWLAQRQTVKNYQNPPDSSLNKTKQQNLGKPTVMRLLGQKYKSRLTQLSASSELGFWRWGVASIVISLFNQILRKYNSHATLVKKRGNGKFPMISTNC